MTIGQNEVATVLKIYNQIKNQLPHITEENRYKMVQEKVFKEYGLKVADEDLSKIVGVQKKLVSRFKKPEMEISNKLPQRPGFQFREDAIKEFNSAPMFKFSLSTTRSAKEVSNKIPFMSKIPRLSLNFGHQKRAENPDDSSKDDTIVSPQKCPEKNIYERLYESRVKPCPKMVQRVQQIRQQLAKPQTPKQPPKTQLCTASEPPTKKSRYSQACLSGQLSSSVFDRLYAERKQFNTKKLTDVQKRELYLKKQRQELRKSQIQRRGKNSKPKNSCECGCSCATESTTSDFDTDEFLGSESDISEVLDATITNSSINIFNSTTTDESHDTLNVQSVLDRLASRFNDTMSLCPIDETVFDD